jgi:mono/diheme cytochrome c family protein
MTMRRLYVSILATLTGVSAAIAIGLALAASPPRDTSHAQVMRGRYLVEAGDCAACHTADGGQPFAGDRPVPTPFGTIYSSNITPDQDTGIGSWSNEDFWKAMHDGLRRNGDHLYPAFPYPWYTRLSHDDVLAIKAYLDTLRPVRQTVRAPELPWPLSWRGSVAGWNMMFFKAGEFTPDSSRSMEWNRGAYLVEGPGHCAACHSPKNFLGGVKNSERFEGGMGEGWFATSLRRSEGEGLGRWSVDDIVSYLKTGANQHARAMGPMAEVVEHSTRYLSDTDLRAIATYLKDLPGDDGKAKSQTASSDTDALNRGQLVYVDQCAGCHMENGEGLSNVFPPIKGNTGVHASDPTSLARLVLVGAESAKTPQRPEGFSMPGFADKLNDSEIADVLTYVRANFGNHADAVSASKVAAVRKSIEHPR